MNSVDKIISDMENSKWNRDINSYYRLKSIHDKYGSDSAKEMMEKIKARWPHHAKAFE